MSMSVTEKHREVTFVEIVQYLSYLEEHYAAIAEVHISTDEDDTSNALLCVTAVGCCKHHRDIRSRTFADCKVAYSQLHRVPSLLLGLLYEVNEKIDGACKKCLEEASILN